MPDPTQRFSDRADTYARYRPSYPPTLITQLVERAQLTERSPVADIGAGTGVFTALVLPVAGRIFAVEPNAVMRSVAEEQFRGNPRFKSVAAPAEATTLADSSVDLITVAQAFHWFEPHACRREFARILRADGFVGLIWNERLTGAAPFMADYDRLLKTQVRDYDQVKHSRIDELVIGAFFQPHTFEKLEAPNDQSFDLTGVIGRALSSSYVPNVGQPGHEEFISELRQTFHRHAQAGRVSFGYVTRLYFGHLR